MLICRECREEVAPEASRCPHCNYEATRDGYWTAVVVQIIGLLLTVTVIGAIVGLPLQWWSYKQMQAARNATVGVDATTS